MSKILIDRQVVEQALHVAMVAEHPVKLIAALRAALAEHQESWEHLMRYGYAPGNYMSRCHNCDKIAYHVDKRAITCRPCAEVRHAESQKTEPVQEPKPVAYIDALKDAFFAGFTSVATYNDMLLNSPEEAWEKYKPPRITPPQPVEEPVAWSHINGTSDTKRHPRPAEPVANDDKVICPACCHQFRAIPPNVQQMMLDAGFEPPFTTPPQRAGGAG